jgi:hypothetical protein
LRVCDLAQDSVIKIAFVFHCREFLEELNNYKHLKGGSIPFSEVSESRGLRKNIFLCV